MQTRSTLTETRASVPSRALAACFCLAFGAFLLWGVGFSQSMTLHNAAHDTRHTNGFPCH